MDKTKQNGKPTELTPAQKRQQIKMERKKKFKDLAIQNTNNSSIASKRSVEKLYLPHMAWNQNTNETGEQLEYFKYFVPKGPKRSPCINRGYWLRLHAIRSRLDSILEGTQGEVLVVNLGCGYDPLAFQLLDKQNRSSKGYQKRFKFLDLDYSDMIESKTSIISNSGDLTKIVGENQNIKSKEFVSENYSARVCNLNDSESFSKLAQELNLDNDNVTKVFIAEVSLAYMLPEKADEIIEACGKLQNSHFIIMEQLIPAGENEPFGKRMLKHFKKNDSPLLSVLKYNTIESQILRFQNLKFKNVNAGDLIQLWYSVDIQTRNVIESIQPFDELEEFHLFGHHYILLHATNYNDFKFSLKYKFEMDKGNFQNVENHLNYKIQCVNMDINRRFGYTIRVPGTKKELYYYGGCNPGRIEDILKIDTASNTSDILEINKNNIPEGRMCHTFTTINDKQCIMVGGRKGPQMGFDDIWIFNIEENEWRQDGISLDSRYRHAACNVGNEQVLVCGGVTKDALFILYDIKLKNFTSCHTAKELKNIDQLISPAMDYNVNSKQGILIGGQINTGGVSDALTVFKYDNDTSSVNVFKTWKHKYFERYGAQARFINDKEILIVGGTSPNNVWDQRNTIVVANIETETMTHIRIPDEIWENKLLCFVGSNVTPMDDGRFVITGGGTTCYGFGAISSDTVVIEFQ